MKKHRNGAPVRTRSQQSELTPAEQKVLRMLLENGCSNKELAERMSIDIETVKAHLKKVMEKTGFGSRGELIANLLHKHYGADRFYGS